MKPGAVLMWVYLLALAVVIGVVDWITGYELDFFVFYFAPVALAAWYLAAGSAVIMAVICSVVWYASDVYSGHTYTSPAYAVWNTIVHLSAFLVIGWSFQKIRGLIEREKESSESLRRSLSEIKLLEGLLPICAECKKIRDEKGQWRQMESYIGEHTNAQFSHGFCPECAKRWMEEAGQGKMTNDE